MGTIGELGFSSYAEGIMAGIDAFVHSPRYSLDVAPQDMIRAVAEQPFSDDLKSPKWKYYKYLTALNMDDARLQEHAKRLGKASTHIMPTLSIMYLDWPGSRNPWNEPIAKILNAEDINNPADRKTGKHHYDDIHLAAYRDLALNLLKIEELYKKFDARYLAGSGTDVWGTMPGISLHTELELLHEIGLSEREAVAAATSNFATAFGWIHTGLIQPGYAADILVLEENPLEDLNNLKRIHLLILQGSIIDRSALLAQ
jgi:hypothetical protein